MTRQKKRRKEKKRAFVRIRIAIDLCQSVWSTNSGVVFQSTGKVETRGETAHTTQGQPATVPRRRCWSGQWSPNATAAATPSRASIATEDSSRFRTHRRVSGYTEHAGLLQVTITAISDHATMLIRFTFSVR